MAAVPEEKALALAEHYLEIRQPERALTVLASHHDLQDARLWELRTHALLEVEEHTRAREAAREGLRVDSDSIVLLDLLAEAELRLGRLEAAEEACLAALRLEPEQPVLLSRYVSVLLRAGELRKAERVLAEAERVDADDPAVVRCRITYEYVRGNDAGVERHSRRLLEEFDPEDPFGHTMLGVRAASRGRFGQASRHHDTAVRHDVTDDDLVANAREARAYAHPLYWPLIPFQRLGPGKAWVFAVGLFALLGALELHSLLLAAVVTYAALCVYSWVAPTLLTRLYERRSP